MARGTAVGDAPILLTQLSAFRNFSHRRWPRARSRYRRPVRGEGSVELERPGERFPQGSPAILGRGMAVHTRGALSHRTLRAGSLALSLLILSSTTAWAQKVRLEILPPPPNAWGDDRPSAPSSG